MAKHPVGRPSTYDPGLALALCSEIAAGDLVTDVCERDGMPSRSTVYRWAETNPEFRDAFARARELQAHAVAERALKAARDATPVDAQAARVKFDAMRWFAAKLLPKVYGERQQVEQTGPGGGPVVTEVVYRWADRGKEE